MQNLNHPAIGHGPLTEDDFPSSAPRIPRHRQAAGDGAGVVLWPLAVLAAVACASFLVWVARK